MRFLLVDPPFRVTYKNYVIPNLGLAYLAAKLLSAGHEARVFNAALYNEPYTEFPQIVREFQPEVTGFSAPTCKINQAAKLAQAAKQAHAATKTLIGGWHVSGVPEETMRQFPVFDFALPGEAEDAVGPLAEALQGRLDFSVVPNLWWRQANQLQENKRQDDHTDLRTLPRPAWELFNLKQTAPMYRRGRPGSFDYPLMTKRGCPYDCLFCPRETGKKVRQRELDDVFAEITEAADKWGADGIQFFDETFTLQHSRTQEFCERMNATGLSQKVLWNCATRADRVSLDLLKSMKGAGCRVIQFGIESGNQNVLDANHKGTTLAQCRDAARWCREAGVMSDMSFIFGLPFDTKQTVRDTARFSRELDPDFVAYFTFIPYPGTPAGDLARRGEANLRMLHEDYARYEQQFSLPCELQDIPAKRLGFLRFTSYLRFFSRPRKWRALFSMMNPASIPRVVLNMVADWLFRR